MIRHIICIILTAFACVTFICTIMSVIDNHLDNTITGFIIISICLGIISLIAPDSLEDF
jgi:hypothetical protein